MLAKLLKILWPIKAEEKSKFCSMAILMFTILLNQNIVRNIKDSLAVNLMGAESLSFIKIAVEVPCSVIFIFLYTKLCNRMRAQLVFRFIVGLFLAYFFVFLFFLFPNLSVLHPDPEVIAHLVSIHPHWRWFITLWSQWVIVSFYVMGELWPIIVFSLLFWQLANGITSTEQACRFYPCLSLFGQSNQIFSSSILGYFTKESNIADLLFSGGIVAVRLKALLLIVIFSGLLCLLIHWYMELKGYSVVVVKSFSLPLRLGVRASVKMVLSSRYLMLLFTIVVSYSFSINLIEGIWMFKARQFYQDTAGLMRYHAKISFCTGAVTLGCAIFGGYIIRRFGWLRAALLTPLMMLFAGSAFFICILIHEGLNDFAMKFGFSALGVLVFTGGIQNVLSKGVKYSIFDTTKEMLYIPLNPEFKTKGKAAVEIIGPKVGKAFGAGLQASIFFLFPRTSYDDIPLILISVFVLVLICWIYSVKSIHESYSAVLDNED